MYSSCSFLITDEENPKSVLKYLYYLKKKQTNNKETNHAILTFPYPYMPQNCIDVALHCQGEKNYIL